VMLEDRYLTYPRHADERPVAATALTSDAQRRVEAAIRAHEHCAVSSDGDLDIRVIRSSPERHKATGAASATREHRRADGPRLPANVRERMAAQGEEGCSMGLGMLVFAVLQLLLRNQIAHRDHYLWTLLAVSAVAWAFIGTAIASSGWLMLFCATRAPDALVESVFKDTEASDESEDRS